MLPNYRKNLGWDVLSKEKKERQDRLIQITDAIPFDDESVF
jgi:hypothetical protein